MALTKEQKKKIIEDLKEKIRKQKIMIFVDFSGLKVKDLSELRQKLKPASAFLKVAKKTLFSIAFKDSNPDLAKEIAKFKKQLAIVFGFEDKILPIKIIYQFSLTNPNLKILAGFFEEEFRRAEEIVTLAQLPSREELLTQLTRSISAPISNLISALEGNLRNLIFVLNALGKIK